MNAFPKPEIYPLGDAALIVEWAQLPEEVAFKVVHTAAVQLSAAQLTGFVEAVPGFSSLAIYYNPLQSDWPVMRSQIADCLARLSVPTTIAGKLVEIPVCYATEFSPDLEHVSQHCGLSVEQIIELHCSASYTVQLIGFAPGFCYLAGLPNQLAVPRLSVPRLRVPAGSVGIGENHTGIYPIEIPGGWNLIGRTPEKLFRPESEVPTLLSPGDSVKFKPISRDEFCEMRASE